MSVRDVDDEFERAYRRLFSRPSAPRTDASPSADTLPPSSPLAESSKAPHLPTTLSRGTSLEPSTYRLDRKAHTSRKDALLYSLSRQHSAGKAISSSEVWRSTQVQPNQLERPQSRSSHSSLEALARYGSFSNVKGKARAQEQHTAHDWNVERVVRSQSIHNAAPPHSVSIPQPGSVAYYSYPQAPYQVPSPTIGMTPMPGQSVTWTQPVMSTGLMPAVAYPGFTTSVTFSQPQLYTSSPQQMQPVITAPLTEAWSQQYTPRQIAATSSIASTSSAAQRPPEQQQTSTSNSQLPEEQCTPAFDRPSIAISKEMGAKKLLQKKWLASEDQINPKMPSRRKAPPEPKKKKKKKKPDTLFLDRKVRMPKKRGCPRMDPLTEDVTPIIGESSGAMQVKTETQEGLPAKPFALSDAACLPLADEAGLPYKHETHFLSVHTSRRLRWLARRAIAKADPRANATQAAALSSTSPVPWARWGFLSAAHYPPLIANENVHALNEDIARSAPSSQSDTAAGFFPREKRKDYVALRKQLHSSIHTATPRVCVPRLVRYLTKAAAAASCIETAYDRRVYLARKHRAAKLAKHMLKPRKPAALDLRRLWSIWARSAHARTKAVSARKRVAFAATTFEQTASLPTRGSVEAERFTRVKQEPESPSKQQQGLLPCKDVTTQSLRNVSISEATGVVKADDEARNGLQRIEEMRRARTDSPLFLRRNFCLYRLVGISDLPLS
ncbi:uncharacterized protein MEPE_00627 [Melanopsichium pennsylvanicum]|uniref:Uncharacterized protein n=2 Tax=Melanopsichium pennsylvanicum TaxID=63383 RepID=A0AAJ4XGJ5_9BASI|nr:putative protein [Melanopsichium pennsylvanicum 4]SNX81922.1 uncharacterized protein MEPE_00627 [Melanopsichium pennsylvanicum]